MSSDCKHKFKRLEFDSEYKCTECGVYIEDWRYIQALESKNKELESLIVKKDNCIIGCDKEYSLLQNHKAKDEESDLNEILKLKSKVKSLEAELNKHKWISVNDNSTPDPEVIVQFACERHDEICVGYIAEDNTWYDILNTDIDGDPIPEYSGVYKYKLLTPPKGE